MSVQHKFAAYVSLQDTEKGLYSGAIHNTSGQLRCSPAVICNASTVCGSCATTGTGKVVEFYDENTYEFQLLDNTVSYNGTGNVNVYLWDRPPNRSATNPPVMLGLSFYQTVAFGSRFTFTPKGSTRWLSFMRKNLAKYNSAAADYYFDSLCVRLNNTTKIITAVSF